MRLLAYVFSVTFVMLTGFWANYENVKTLEVSQSIKKTQAEMNDVKETLNVLTVEWAYLNRPERLQNLANLNYKSLGLLPISSNQMKSISSIDFEAIRVSLK